jgi:hypothetical protein
MFGASLAVSTDMLCQPDPSIIFVTKNRIKICYVWVLSFQKRLAMKKVFLMPYKQSKPSFSNRYEDVE